MKKTINVGIILLLFIFLQGCTSVELDDKSFPLALGIDLEGEELLVSFGLPDLAQETGQDKAQDSSACFQVKVNSFEEAKAAYYQISNKNLDFNHLKVIILGENFLKSKEEVAGVLMYLENNEMFARNTLLCMTQGSVGDLISIQEIEGTSVGAFLEELLINEHNFKKEMQITLGDFYSQWHSGNENILLPTIGVVSQLQTMGFGIFTGLTYLGQASIEDGKWIYLGRGIACDQIIDISNMQICLEKVSLECEMENKKTPIVNYKITGTGKILNQNVKDATQKERLKIMLDVLIKEKLERVIQSYQINYGIELTNSFLKMGTYNRDVYKEFGKYFESYNQMAVIHYKTDISLKN